MGILVHTDISFLDSVPKLIRVLGCQNWNLYLWTGCPCMTTGSFWPPQKARRSIGKGQGLQNQIWLTTLPTTNSLSLGYIYSNTNFMLLASFSVLQHSEWFVRFLLVWCLANLPKHDCSSCRKYNTEVPWRRL